MMKKNKLYTVNRFNRPAFMSKENLFLNGGFDLSGAARNYFDGSSANRTFDMNLGTSMEQQYLDSKNALGISKAANPFSKYNLAQAKEGLVNAGTGVAAAGIGMLGNAAGNAIAGGKTSAAGNVVGSLGSMALGAAGTAIGGPLGGAIGSAVGNVLGGLTNAAFGSELNEQKIAEVEDNNAKRRAENDELYKVNSTDDLFNSIGNMTSAMSFSEGDIGSDGWFSSDAEDKYDELKKEQEKINRLRSTAIGTTTAKVNRNQYINSMKNNLVANGGPLFMRGLDNLFDFGGDLQVHGGDYPTGLTHIDTGKSHEENPNDGVQMGVDPEGTPNLVEEGETVYDDYVFSNRILADEATKKLFRLPKKKDITFAEISKRLEKEIAERPNDPISEAGFKAQMQTLEEQQERQKQEMEAERAKAAFEALSPEEQAAVMQQVAQQEAMAQEAAQQQAIAEQQAVSNGENTIEMQGGEPTEEAVGTVAPQDAMEQSMMAEGGNLYAKGSYLWDKFWSPVNEYSKKKGNAKNKYQIDKTYKGDIKKLEDSEAYKAFTDYILNNATDEERLKYFRWIDDNTGRERTYTNDKGELLEGWQDKYKAARNDGLYGIQHYTPEWKAAENAAVQATNVVSAIPEVRTHHVLEGDEDYIQGELDPNVVGDEIKRETLPNGDIVIHHARKATTTPEEAAAEEVASDKIEPKLKSEWPRYAGLFGPAVGLGMMASGIGKPDYGYLDEAVRGAGNVHLASYKPLGNYLTYRPMDIWFEQNRMDANARATDRAIQNNAGPLGTKIAGLLASGYNNQIASGQLYRNALEYNGAKRKEVAEFNRGTDQYNADAFTGNSRFNASALNEAESRKLNARLHAASERMNRDASWYNSLYGNVGQLFKGLSDLGRENAQWNMIARGAADGVYGNLGDSYTGQKVIKKAAKGGKVRRKRGLTY